MRLLNCHVENFGKLSDFQMNFENGLNACFKENGWGKSTLASFLKVMFYGFGNEKKRNQNERERDKYKPWQGGTYGGSVEFEVSGKKYRMERFFGEKEKDDIFTLYNLHTGLPTVEYSKEIGKELFRLDEESFLKTIYVSGLDCSTSATDSIHAKLGNLTDSMYDLENYTKAMQLMQQEINRLTPKRKTGLLAKQEEEMFVFQDQLVESVDRVKLMEQKKEKMEEAKAERERLLFEQGQIQAEIKKIGENQELYSKQALYDALCGQLREKELEMEELEEQFGMGIPESEEISKTIALVEQQKLLEALIEKNTLSVEEAALLEEIEQQWINIPTYEDVEKYRQGVSETKESESDDKEETSEDSEIEVPIRAIYSLVFLGITICALGAVLCYNRPFLGFFIFSIGIVCGLVADRRKQREQELTKELLKERINEASAQKNEEQEVTENTSAELETFLAQHPVDDVQNATEHLNKIQIIIAQLGNIQTRKATLLETMGTKEKVDAEIAGFYIKYGIEQSDLKDVQLQSLLSILQKYQNLQSEFEKLQKKKADYEMELGILPNQNPENMQDGIGSLNERLQENLRKEKEIHQLIYKLQSEIDDYENNVEQDMERKLQASNLKEEMDKNQRKYHLITLARDYMKEAKEQFVARYRNPLANSFEKYAGIVLEQQEDFLVDVNLDVRKKEVGMYRKSQTLSDGWKDLIAICLRISVVDAMYANEKPFLILDDPFLNLDNEKMQGAFRLLNEIEKEYQVIYFSCHDSRIQEEVVDTFEQKKCEFRRLANSAY